ncbi:SurA N-terminal domain-containing protein [Desulfovibrio ferrophilus]|uniref:SurA domain-containing protein n=1 Tax=Desulfovibrio ferrophilus TaxID=241368 RepID=A0A2Z6AWP4_9BACT|nr:SurA N-terminal domain-containing protein [Desulfovibrio ferrophilus]BBD07618.1 SurA domain-containing protein [Desulfovibrio ferrophilus]
MLSIIRIAILVVALTSVQPAVAGDVVDRIVGMVNGEIITLFDLNERMKPVFEKFQGREVTDKEKAAIVNIRKNLLEQMVQDILIKQQIAKLGVTVTDSEILNEMESVQSRNKMSKEDFEAQLRLEGMTVEQYKKKLGDDILKHRLIGAMVKRKVVVSDEEVKSYFDEHRSQYAKDKRVELAVILVPTKDGADKLHAAITKGEMTFAEAAAKYSQGPGTDQGGNLGTLEWGSIASDWRDALEGVQPGGLSKSFEFRQMGAILQLVSVAGGEALEFDAVVEAEIRQKLYQQQLEERFNSYMERLRSEAVVEIKL